MLINNVNNLTLWTDNPNITLFGFINMTNSKYIVQDGYNVLPTRCPVVTLTENPWLNLYPSPVPVLYWLLLTIGMACVPHLKQGYEMPSINSLARRNLSLWLPHQIAIEISYIVDKHSSRHDCQINYLWHIW